MGRIKGSQDRPYDDDPYYEMSSDFRADAPVAFDFFPLLSMQEKYHTNATCYMLYADKNMPIEEVTNGTRKTVVPIGGHIEKKPSNSQQTRLRIGSLDPWRENSDNFLDEKLGRAISSSLLVMSVMDMNIQKLGLKYKIPKNLADNPLFDGAEYICHEMETARNNPLAVERDTDTKVMNTRDYAKAELESRGKDASPIENMGSYLRTRAIFADNGVGHEEMWKEGVLGEVVFSTHLSEFENTGYDFTRDIGIPVHPPGMGGQHTILQRIGDKMTL